MSSGPGSGFVTLEPDRAFAADTLDLLFGFEADGGELTQVSIAVPSDWDFSGLTPDVLLDGPGFATALTEATSGLVVLTGCELTRESLGTVTLVGMVAPASAGTYPFEVKTADEGNDLADIQAQPEIGVGVFADAGTVLINEIYAYSGGSDLNDRAEFIELYNPGDGTVDLTGWVLTDINDEGYCAGSNLWEFPEGTELAAGDYVVIAKDAKGSYGQGFYYVFWEWPDFELVDPYRSDVESPNDVEAMILVTPYDGNPSVKQEIRLIGGADGNGTLIAGTPSYEAVLLYTDRTMSYLVDAVEYRDPVFLAEDPCADAPGLGGIDDAWTPGPPPAHTSLARNEMSDDTDVSRDDFSLLAPTPGEQNPTSDESAPTVALASGASHNLALVKFSKPMDSDDAEDRANYTVGDGVVVLEATLSRDGRTVRQHHSHYRAAGVRRERLQHKGRPDGEGRRLHDRPGGRLPARVHQHVHPGAGRFRSEHLRVRAYAGARARGRSGLCHGRYRRLRQQRRRRSDDGGGSELGNGSRARVLAA